MWYGQGTQILGEEVSFSSDTNGIEQRRFEIVLDQETLESADASAFHFEAWLYAKKVNSAPEPKTVMRVSNVVVYGVPMDSWTDH